MKKSILFAIFRISYLDCSYLFFRSSCVEFFRNRESCEGTIMSTCTRAAPQTNHSIKLKSASTEDGVQQSHWLSQLRQSRRLALMSEMFFLPQLFSRLPIIGMLVASACPWPLGVESFAWSAGWCILYLAVVALLTRFEGASQLIEGCPRWSFQVSLVHQLGKC